LSRPSMSSFVDGLPGKTWMPGTRPGMTVEMVVHWSVALEIVVRRYIDV